MSSRLANRSQCKHQTTLPAVSDELTSINVHRMNVPLPYEHITAQEIKATATHDITAIPLNDIRNRITVLPMPAPLKLFRRDSDRLYPTGGSGSISVKPSGGDKRTKRGPTRRGVGSVLGVALHLARVCVCKGADREQLAHPLSALSLPNQLLNALALGDNVPSAQPSVQAKSLVVYTHG